MHMLLDAYCKTDIVEHKVLTNKCARRLECSGHRLSLVSRDSGCTYLPMYLILTAMYVTWRKQKLRRQSDLQARLNEAGLVALWELEGSAWRGPVLLGPALLKDVIKVLMLV